MTRSKDIGTAAETAVVRWLRGIGYDQADRIPLKGALDSGDVQFTSERQTILEVKGGHAAEGMGLAQRTLWMEETERERNAAGAAFGFLVTKKKGVGAGRAGEWLVHAKLSDVLNLRGFPAAAYAPDAVVTMTLAHLIGQLAFAGQDR